MNTRLRGVIAASPTIFDDRGAPDLARTVAVGRDLLANGCDALNVLGTTGEATSLSVAERIAVMEAMASALPPARLMVGTGAAAVTDAVMLTQAAARLGFAAALGIDRAWSWTLLWSLLVFNVGIEAVQLAIVATVFPVLALLRRHRPVAGLWATGAVAAGVSLMGLVWFVQRTSGI